MSDIVTGVSKSGNKWARMSVTLDIPGYQGTITKQVFQVFGDDLDDVMKFKVGDRVTIGWSMYAREWNGRWYNNVDLVKINSQDDEADLALPAPKAKAEAKAEAKPETYSADDLNPELHEDDLPW